MNSTWLERLLNEVKSGKIEISDAMSQLKTLPFEDLDYAKIDHHRELRKGYPEVIYCEGKTLEQISEIVQRLLAKGTVNVLATRANKDIFVELQKVEPSVQYYEKARIIYIERKKVKTAKSSILVISAGTSDIPVAEEAVITAMVMGNKVERLYDVGVAGIHRLFANMNLINKSKVIIVVAGMEGALPSVVGGLVDKPVIAVPTDVGYGASFNGLTALLAMLNSCSSGIGVVNINNGFGAGYLASLINRG